MSLYGNRFVIQAITYIVGKTNLPVVSIGSGECNIEDKLVLRSSVDVIRVESNDQYWWYEDTKPHYAYAWCVARFRPELIGNCIMYISRIGMRVSNHTKVCDTHAFNILRPKYIVTYVPTMGSNHLPCKSRTSDLSVFIDNPDKYGYVVFPIFTHNVGHGNTVTVFKRIT